MVSKYDVFYVIATKGEISVKEIVEELHKTKEEYNAIFNHVIELEKEEYIKRDIRVKVFHNKKSIKLFRLISFCINNSINYNLIFKNTMLEFLKKAAKKEFFTIKNIKVHPQTFKIYIDTLSKYGLLLTISKKPLKCKLLRHHFIFDIMKFFNKKIEFYTPKQHSFIKEIKKELKVYRKNLKIHYNIIEKIEDKEEANFIYSSLKLEGNPLTLPETQKLILKDIVPEKKTLKHIQEVTNYKKAVNAMIENAKKKTKLDLKLILEYHKTAMQQIKEAGKIRKQNVIIRNSKSGISGVNKVHTLLTIKKNPKFKTCDWHKIDSKLDLLMEKYDEFETKKKDIKEIIEFASFFHNEFQRIHPFIDGNSRISRLLMLHILRNHKIPIMELPLGYFDTYLDLTKKSTQRDDKAFKYLIEEIILMDLKKINSLV